MKKTKGVLHENYKHPDAFGILLGFKVKKIDRKKHYFEGQLKIQDHHLSPAGRVHGGVMSAFVDYSCGGAVFSTLSSNEFTSTIELKINYLSPLFLGDLIHSRANVIFRGNRLCVLQCFLYRNKVKAPVAMATATFNIVKT
jgi:uncharacterized protein (TIGR00369 family)